jgi:ubiquinone biosynthesis protein COQ9
MALRTLLRTPPGLRSLLLQQQRCLYHSYEHASPPPYREPEASILASALDHVPVHGFTQDALTLGVRSAGYPDISTTALFPKGAFSIVLYHLVTQRLALKDRVQFPTEMGVGRKVRALTLARLRANADPNILPQWQQGLGLMSLAENIPASLKELANLSDEIWFLAGDVSVDASWYTKRASLSAVYAAAEMFQTTDQSTEFRDTEAFLDRRLDEVRTVGGAVGNTIEWAAFQGAGLVHLARSKGVRI